jgi:diacylglycerol kinase family enzyme
MFERPAVVVNPTKVGDIARLRRIVRGRLEGSEEPMWLETTLTDPGTIVTRSAITRGADLVLSYGGDGTHRACAAALAGTGIPLALLPAGTGNLLARRLGVPSRLDGALEVAVHGRQYDIDVGRANGKPFVLMAGLGFDAAILAHTSATLKLRIGWLAYWMSALRMAGRSPVLRVHLEFADRSIVTLSGVGVVIANIGALPGGANLLPLAVEDDGALAVAVLTSDSLVHWALLMGASLAKRTPSPQRLPCWQASRVHVTLDQPTLMQVDGEVLERFSEVDFTVDFHALTVCIPP